MKAKVIKTGEIVSVHKDWKDYGGLIFIGYTDENGKMYRKDALEILPEPAPEKTVIEEQEEAIKSKYMLKPISYYRELILRYKDSFKKRIFPIESIKMCSNGEYCLYEIESKIYNGKGIYVPFLGDDKYIDIESGKIIDFIIPNTIVTQCIKYNYKKIGRANLDEDIKTAYILERERIRCRRSEISIMSW